MDWQNHYKEKYKNYSLKDLKLLLANARESFKETELESDAVKCEVLSFYIKEIEAFEAEDNLRLEEY